jgi:hypothetical protein
MFGRIGEKVILWKAKIRRHENSVFLVVAEVGRALAFTPPGSHLPRIGLQRTSRRETTAGEGNAPNLQPRIEQPDAIRPGQPYQASPG